MIIVEWVRGDQIGKAIIVIIRAGIDGVGVLGVIMVVIKMVIGDIHVKKMSGELMD